MALGQVGDDGLRPDPQGGQPQSGPEGGHVLVGQHPFKDPADHGPDDYCGDVGPNSNHNSFLVSNVLTCPLYMD